ncbi:MAG TPA: helix-turn-helix transcriptional regulator [Solirubrobacterales bacterium]|nr:helix-turn-helix transcriptional regulator [Solirubrobacterales bacterium]
MPNPLAVRVGNNLKAARKRVGLSQEEAAIRASLHRSEIGLLERGERMPRIDTVVKLAGALGVPAAELLDGIEWTPGEVQLGSFEVSEAAQLAREAREELEEHDRRAERLVRGES